jgi:hypothetical protein
MSLVISELLGEGMALRMFMASLIVLLIHWPDCTRRMFIVLVKAGCLPLKLKSHHDPFPSSSRTAAFVVNRQSDSEQDSLITNSIYAFIPVVLVVAI